jgi:hypothetical protein
MKNFIFTMTMVFTLSATIIFGQVSMDDLGFKPAAEGGEKTVQKPDAVKIDDKTKTVQADSMQDGINAAVKDITSAPDKGASRIIQVKSGIAYIAVGSSNYADPEQLKNPTAIRMSKRRAYVIAFQRAKAELAKFLGEMSIESKETMKESLKVTITDEGDKTEISADSEEAINRATAMILRGYVVYDVEDNMEELSVRVSIVTSPATRGEVERKSNGVMTVKSIAAGMQHVLTEINTGIVPPVGGRVIYVPQTGESAFIGFGSAIVPISQNKSIQARLNQTAKNFAQARAESALCKSIIGDEFQWSNGMSETSTENQSDSQQTQELTNEIKKENENDPISAANVNGSKEAKDVAKIKDAFQATIEDSEEFKSAFSGKIPAGTNSKTWVDGDSGWAYSFCCYIPSSANIAAGIKKSMETVQIVKPVKAMSSLDDSKKAEKQGKANIKGPSNEIRKGVSGDVSKNDDL